MFWCTESFDSEQKLAKKNRTKCKLLCSVQLYDQNTTSIATDGLSQMGFIFNNDDILHISGNAQAEHPNTFGKNSFVFPVDKVPKLCLIIT